MASASVRPADAEFADVICADPEWLRAEFDALISASFGEPPAPPPAAPPRLPPDRGARYPGRGWSAEHLPGPEPGRRTTTGRGRQRAPPR
jgi:hypothetical protein